MHKFLMTNREIGNNNLGIIGNIEGIESCYNLISQSEK